MGSRRQELKAATFSTLISVLVTEIQLPRVCAVNDSLEVWGIRWPKSHR